MGGREGRAPPRGAGIAGEAGGILHPAGRLGVARCSGGTGPAWISLAGGRRKKTGRDGQRGGGATTRESRVHVVVVTKTGRKTG